jgi:K+-sensing histidine kinase KdpD
MWDSGRFSARPVRAKRHRQGHALTHFRAPHQFSQRELRLTDLYLRLASEMIERAQIKEALHAARQAARRGGNRAKDRFLATASHDFEAAASDPVFPLPGLTANDQRSDAGEVIAVRKRRSASMSELLNALLDISKLESGAVEPQVGDVAWRPYSTSFAWNSVLLRRARGFTSRSACAAKWS